MTFASQMTQRSVGITQKHTARAKKENIPEFVIHTERHPDWVEGFRVGEEVF